MLKLITNDKQRRTNLTHVRIRIELLLFKMAFKNLNKFFLVAFLLAVSRTSKALYGKFLSRYIVKRPDFELHTYFVITVSITGKLQNFIEGEVEVKSVVFFVRKSVVLHLLEGPELRTHHSEEREEKKPSTQQDLNPQPLCYKACALPLCYNRCPKRLVLV